MGRPIFLHEETLPIDMCRQVFQPMDTVKGPLFAGILTNYKHTKEDFAPLSKK